MIICLCGASGFVGSNFITRTIDEHEIVVLTRNVGNCLDELIKVKPDIESYLNKKLYVMSYEDALDAYTYLYGKTQDMSNEIADINNFIIRIHDKSRNEDIITAFNKLMDADAVINLAGESIAQKFLSNKRLEEIKESRLDVIQKLNSLFLKHDNITKDRFYLQASATGIYDESDYDITEQTAEGDNFLAEIAKSAENKALNLFGKKNLAILRFGVIVGKTGGICKALAGIPAFNIISRNYVPFISIDDAINAMLFIIKGRHHGVFNMVSPEPCRCYELLRAVFNRQTFLFWIPGFIVKSTDKRGMLLTLNQKVKPENLIQCGYKFKHETIEQLRSDLHLK